MNEKGFNDIQQALLTVMMDRDDPSLKTGFEPVFYGLDQSQVVGSTLGGDIISAMMFMASSELARWHIPMMTLRWATF